MTERLRVGVVGANPEVGWAPRTHIPALLALPELELAAVCTSRRETAEASAAKFEAGRAYWDYRELVSDQTIDIVDVVVRPPLHYEVVMAALEAGKHVYCEWPLAANVMQAAEMAALAESKVLHTMVGLQARGAESILYLQRLVADGWIGDVVMVNMSQLMTGLGGVKASEDRWRADKAAGAHPIAIHGGHSIYALTWCVGPLVEVAGVVDTLSPEWRFEDGSQTIATAPDHLSFTGRGWPSLDHRLSSSPGQLAHRGRGASQPGGGGRLRGNGSVSYHGLGGTIHLDPSSDGRRAHVAGQAGPAECGGDSGRASRSDPNST